MTPDFRLVVGVAMLALALSGAFHPRSALGQTRPTIVEVQKSAKGVAYKIDSKPADLTPSTSLLHLLALVHERRGASAPIVVLLDSAVPIDQIWNVDGTAGKAQLTNLRYFVVDHTAQTMVEIRWGSTMPYSTNPAADPDPLRIRPERR